MRHFSYSFFCYHLPWGRRYPVASGVLQGALLPPQTSWVLTGAQTSPGPKKRARGSLGLDAEPGCKEPLAMKSRSVSKLCIRVRL